jgi:sulfate permease, SulP family
MVKISEEVRNYFQHSVRYDLIAGATVAMIALPQAMAYAAIAGVNPVNGIYTAIIPTLVGALTGSSIYLITGPSNASSLVTNSVLAQANDPLLFVELVFILAIVSGMIKLVLGLLRMGGIIRYISNSVMTGFLGAIGILITLEQFGNLLGIVIPKNQGALAILIATIHKSPEINLRVLATSAACIAFLLILRKIDRRLPSAMLAIIFGALLVALTGWHSQGVKLVSDLGLPANSRLAFHLPQAPLKNIIALLPNAGAVALFSLVEAMSIARALSLSSGKKIDPSREFIGQGLASIAGGFMQCLPSSGSPTRSAVNYNSGAKTRLAAAFSGILVWLMLVLFSAWIGKIPMAGLAAVVVVSAIGLIDLKHITMTWNTRPMSRLVMVTTIVATLLMPLQYAIYLGVILTIINHLFESSHLHLSFLVFGEHGQIIERPIKELSNECPKVMVINVEGDLFFGAVNELEDSFNQCRQAGVKVLILRVRRMRMLASTGILTLQGLLFSGRKAGMTILLSEVSPEIHSILNTSKVTQLIGEANIFGSTDILFEATRRAVEQAELLAG